MRTSRVFSQDSPLQSFLKIFSIKFKHVYYNNVFLFGFKTVLNHSFEICDENKKLENFYISREVITRAFEIC